MPPGVAEPRLGPHSRILEAYWETNNNVQRGKGHRKNRFLPQVKVAMVISGEFLVSVHLAAGRVPGAGEGAGRSSQEMVLGGAREGLG